MKGGHANEEQGKRGVSRFAVGLLSRTPGEKRGWVTRLQGTKPGFGWAEEKLLKGKKKKEINGTVTMAPPGLWEKEGGQPYEGIHFWSGTGGKSQGVGWGLVLGGADSVQTVCGLLGGGGGTVSSGRTKKEKGKEKKS